MNHPKIAIIIVNWNGLDDTIECLRSIKDITYANYMVIVVDNGSTDNSVTTIQQQFPSVSIIETHKNLGFAGGNNVGIQRAKKNKCDYYFLLNNDTIVDKNILHELMKGAINNKKAGIFGTKVLRYYDKGVIDHLGGMWNKDTAQFVSIGAMENDSDVKYGDTPVDYVCGCSILIKKEVVAKIGLLEEKFFLLWEEADYCYRAKKWGYTTSVIPQAKVWHKISASFTGSPHSQYYWWRNRLLWIERNCSKQEIKYLYKKVLLKEIFRLYKLKYVKSVMFVLSQLLFWSKKNVVRKNKLLRYKAGCKGIEDYLFKRFGKGPKWLCSLKK
jgi:GT2 family glycosyltransferase